MIRSRWLASLPSIRLHIYLFLICLLSAGNCVFAVTYTLNIAPYDEECFLLSFPSHTWTSPKRLVGNYELVDDSGISAEPLLAYVMAVDDKGTVLWSKVGASLASFDVEIANGPDSPKRYWLCIQNSSHHPNSEHSEEAHPDLKSRVVGFAYHLVDNDQPVDESKRSLSWEEENVADWNKRSTDIKGDLRTLVEHHQYLKVREASHRSLVERTFVDVLQWTLVEAFMVVLVAVGQVMYFRRFLENKRYIQ